MDAVVDPRSNTQALHQIQRWPVDLREPIYADYSLFKLGVRRHVRHYAERLAPLAAELILQSEALLDWVLASPPHRAMPCAANLLCWDIADILQQSVANGRVAPSVVNLRYESPISPPDSAGDAQLCDYSQLSWNDRTKSLQDGNHRVIPDARLARRAVIFVNDINVTGAQQRDMQVYFERVNAAAVHWLYIFNVDESIGQAEPQLEHAINNAIPLSIEEFAGVLNEEEIAYTTKCLWRLMACERSDLERIFGALHADRRSAILRLVVGEGRFEGDAFREKVEILKACCQ
jgi:hypothetical protein